MTSSEFFDLDPDTRASVYQRAEQDEGMPWHDLEPETRGRYMQRAVDDFWVGDDS